MNATQAVDLYLEQDSRSLLIVVSWLAMAFALPLRNDDL
jgi:hypothetical protein